MSISEDTYYKLLMVFADNLPHPWVEVVYLGTVHLNCTQKHTEKLLQHMAVNNQWIYRLFTTADLQSDKLQITKKGDEFYRYLSIRRGGDYRYFKYFNREEESHGFGSFGLDKYAPLSPNLQKIGNNHNGTK